MYPTFANKEIVWAKVKGYPWWPAEVAKLPTTDNNFYKVIFIAEDTHAFLHPKDVRKYSEYYQQCCKKKMRGLAPAIQTADQLHKKRIQALSKVPSSNSEPVSKKGRGKQSTKRKPIRKYNSNKSYRQSESQSSEQPLSQDENEKVSLDNEEQEMEISLEKEESELNSNDNLEEQKFIIESEEKADRNKIDSMEENLLKIIEKIKDNNYTFSQNDFAGLDALTGDELLLSKITNLLNFIISKLHLTPTETQSRWLKKLKSQLKQRIIDHLYDTSYYDQYIKLIQKNKKNRNEYESKLTLNLKNQYRLKKEIAVTFANRLMTEINNGTISKEKELLEDLKEHRLEIINVNNKAAIDRCIEHLSPKYI